MKKPVLGSIFNKVADLHAVTFLNRDSNSGVSCGYCKMIKNTFFHRTPPVAPSDSPTTEQ